LHFKHKIHGADRKGIGKDMETYVKMNCDCEARVVRFQREAAIWSHLHHPYIVTMIGLLEQGSGGQTRRRLVMEWCSGGTLRSALVGRELDGMQRHWVLEQVLNALAYLSSKGIVHNDVKSANVFFVQKVAQGELPTVKLGDFGQAETMKELRRGLGDASVDKSQFYWVPPETWQPDGGRASDVWAFGMLCLETLTLAGAQREELGQAWRLVEQGRLQLKAPGLGWATQLVKSCLRRDPHERADFADITLAWQYLRSAYGDMPLPQQRAV